MNDDQSENNFAPNSPRPLQGELLHRAMTARVREQASRGTFANAAIVLSGLQEFVIDFILRMGQNDRIAARVILAFPVAEQFVHALNENLSKYERQFGPITLPGRTAGAVTPAVSQPRADAVSPPQAPPIPSPPPASAGGVDAVEAQPADPASVPPPAIEEIYAELKLEDDMLGGVYANGVLIRHTAAEFCFDFVANIFPRSIVNARVFMAAPHVPSLVASLAHSCEQFRRRQDHAG